MFDARAALFETVSGTAFSADVGAPATVTTAIADLSAGQLAALIQVADAGQESPYTLLEISGAFTATGDNGECTVILHRHDRLGLWIPSAQMTLKASANAAGGGQIQVPLLRGTDNYLAQITGLTGGDVLHLIARGGRA